MLEEKLNKYFKLPIDFCKETVETPDNLYDDLELLQAKDQSGNAVYNHLFNPKSPFGAVLLQKWAKKYTTDIKFLKDTQRVLKGNKDISKDEEKSILDAWLSFKDIKEDKNFIDKYQYIGWKYLKFLNGSVLFLTVLSAYSILSPLSTLLAPTLLLIIPFILLSV